MSSDKCPEVRVMNLQKILSRHQKWLSGRGDKRAEGWFINRGCFRGSVDEFLVAVEKKHGDNRHGRFYRGVIDLCCNILDEVDN